MVMIDRFNGFILVGNSSSLPKLEICARSKTGSVTLLTNLLGRPDELRGNEVVLGLTGAEYDDIQSHTSVEGAFNCRAPKLLTMSRSRRRQGFQREKSFARID